MTNNLLTQAEALQNLLVSRATGGGVDNVEFIRLRKMLVSSNAPDQLMPRFINTCRDINQFWQFIKHKYDTYEERRNYLWSEFRPLLEFLERGGASPSDASVAIALQRFDAEHVKAEWKKALDRRISDPDGAITIARTLIESVCKHILDEEKISHSDLFDLPKLYKKTAEKLHLLPSQHEEQIFKQILGGCSAVVEGLGALRNRQGDAHGKGKNTIKPAPRHAELAVNLSGALASYLIATWEHRNKQ